MGNSPFSDALETLQMISKELENILTDFSSQPPEANKMRLRELRKSTAITVSKLSPANANFDNINLNEGEKNA
jgi:hypothetical protein